MATLTIPKKITKEVKTIIAQIVYEALNDPDFNLELSEKAKKRLRRTSFPELQTSPFSEIRKKYY